MWFDKDDDLDDANSLDCRSPGQDIVYTICWDNTNGETQTNVSIIDWLPDGVDYDWLVSIDPLVIDANYNPDEHYYKWDLDTIDPNTSGCVQLRVTVNQNAEPGRYLHNVAEMVSNDVVIARAVKDTLVCCWDTSGILYVDQSAQEADTGLDWANAYTDLTDAIERAARSICAQPFTIYVA